MRTDRLRLLDAIERIELISSFSESGRETFFNDLIVPSAILHRLAVGRVIAVRPGTGKVLKRKESRSWSTLRR